MEEKLVGRWVKKIKSDAWNSLKKVGEYDIIEEEDSYKYMLKEAKTYYTDSYPKLLDFFELMPIGWTPEQQSPQFIVGKWYKNLKEKGFYGKFKALKPNNRFECSEFIDINHNYQKHEYDDSSWFYEDDGHELLKDLSEIQEYLPSGHPDKIKSEENLSIENLVKYEYYYTKEEGYWSIFRFKSDKKQNKAEYSCLINCIDDFRTNDWVSLNNRITRKATKEEIEWLELCSKHSKFIPFDEISSYKETSKQENNFTPEYVECINSKFHGNHKVTVGKIYTFPNIIFNNGEKLNLNNNFNVWLKEFKPSTKEAYNLQFIKQQPLLPEDCYSQDVIEIGDEVEIITSVSNNWYKIGETYKVVKISQDKIHIDNATSYWIDRKDCKLTKKANQTTNHKKVDFLSPKVENNKLPKEKSLAHLLGIKKEYPNRPKRTHLTIIKTKQLKLN